MEGRLLSQIRVSDRVADRWIAGMKTPKRSTRHPRDVADNCGKRENHKRGKTGQMTQGCNPQKNHVEELGRQYSLLNHLKFPASSRHAGITYLCFGFPGNLLVQASFRDYAQALGRLCARFVLVVATAVVMSLNGVKPLVMVLFRGSSRRAAGRDGQKQLNQCEMIGRNFFVRSAIDSGFCISLSLHAGWRSML
jgi:hypothetical protein